MLIEEFEKQGFEIQDADVVVLHIPAKFIVFLLHPGKEGDVLEEEPFHVLVGEPVDFIARPMHEHGLKLFIFVRDEELHITPKLPQIKELSKGERPCLWNTCAS